MEKIKVSELCNFSEKQMEAYKAVMKNKYVLYGGAMGGGKSYWLRWMMVLLLLYWFKKGHRNVTVALFCENYPALKDRHLNKIKFEFPEWLGKYNGSDHNFVLAKEYGGGVISFRNLDDASKYQSSEFACIGIDEITKNQEDVFHFLRTRLRWPNLKKTKFIAATNPGGIGHAWVKRYWLDGDFPETESERDQFAYIRALATDNPHLDTTYIDSLSGLPEDMRKAFVEGDWNLFKGQYFTTWRDSIHVIAPHALPVGARPFICMDYGYSNPSAAYWCYKDFDDTVYVYRELYEKNLTYEQLMTRIIEMTPRSEEIDFLVADPAIWARKGEVDVSGAQIMQDTHKALTGKLIRMIKGDNNRVQGWNVMRQYLQPFEKNGKIVAKLLVFSTCTALIKTLPSLVYDKTRVEDLDSDGEDHAADAIRYGLMSNPKAGPAREINPVSRLLERRPTGRTKAKNWY